MPSFLNAIFGSKPKVPKLEELDLSEEQRKAIEANIAAAPEAARLSNLTADQIDALIRRQFPNLSDVNLQATENIESLLRGEIPADVSALVKRSDAARALAGGYTGTGMHGALEARDLGLTSLNLMDRGLSQAESWLAASERLYSPAMNVFTGMFVTPMQQAAFDVEERNTQFQRSWLKNQISAMPDPVARGIHDTIMSLASAFLGASYGGTYNPTTSAAAAGSSGGVSNAQGGGWGGWDGSGTPPPAYGGEDWNAIDTPVSPGVPYG